MNKSIPKYTIPVKSKAKTIALLAKRNNGDQILPANSLNSEEIYNSCSITSSQAKIIIRMKRVVYSLIKKER